MHMSRDTQISAGFIGGLKTRQCIAHVTCYADAGHFDIEALELYRYYILYHCNRFKVGLS